MRWSMSGADVPKHGSNTKGFTQGFFLGISDFDDTLGFPGEGPRFNIISTNVNRWSSFEKAYQEGKMPEADIHCIQEHRLSNFNNELGRAQTWCKARDLAHSFSAAQITPKGGRSSGEAFMWNKHKQVQVAKHVEGVGPGSKPSMLMCRDSVRSL